MSALIEELNIGIRLLLQQTGSDPEVVFFEDNPRALQLTFILEKILSHGLKDLHIFGKTTFWEFVNHLPECLPAKEAKEKIDMVSSMSKSNLGRARLFLRIALNDGCLPEYLSALIWNRHILHSCYEERALLRDEEQSSTLILLIETLKKLRFRMFLKDPNLDRPDFWSTVKLLDVISAFPDLPPDRSRPAAVPHSQPHAPHILPSPQPASASPVISLHASQEQQHPTNPLEKMHQLLLGELKESIRSLIATDNIIYDSSSDVPRFFLALESILQTDFHDSKSIQLFGTTCYWAYFERIDECLPEGAALRSSLLSEAVSITTDLGRARSFLCLCMNEGSLAETLRSLLWNEPVTAGYYKPSSLLRHPEQVSILLTLIDSLTKVNFSLKVNVPDYDDPTLWVRRNAAVLQVQNDYRDLMLNQRTNQSLLDPDDLVASRAKKPARRKKTKIVEIPSDTSPIKIDPIPGSRRKTPKESPKLSPKLSFNPSVNPESFPQPFSPPSPLPSPQPSPQPSPLPSPLPSPTALPQPFLNLHASSESPLSIIELPNSSPPLPAAAFTIEKSVGSPRFLNEPSESPLLVKILPASSPLQYRKEAEPLSSSPHPISTPPATLLDATPRHPSPPLSFATATPAASAHIASPPSLARVPPATVPNFVNIDTFFGHPSASSSSTPATASSLTPFQSEPHSSPPKFSPKSASLSPFSSSSASTSTLISSTPFSSSIPAPSSSSTTPPMIRDATFDDFVMPPPKSPVFTRAPHSISLTEVVLADQFHFPSSSSPPEPVNRTNDLKPRVRDHSTSTAPEQQVSDRSSLIAGSDSLSQPLTLSMSRFIKGSIPAARCRGCGTIFERPTMFSKTQARFCYYTGGWYCKGCHRNDMSVIPGQVLHRWDFTRFPVSSQSAFHISSLATRPILDVLVLNPELYSAAPALNDTRRIRTKLMLIAEFCKSCQRSATTLFQKIADREYLVGDIHLYSLRDLEAINAHKFAPVIQALAKHFLSHISDCIVCKGRGFLCFKCKSPELLFPFDNEKIHRCPACSAVYHKRCYKPTLGDQCLVCEQRAALRAKRTR